MIIIHYKDKQDNFKIFKDPVLNYWEFLKVIDNNIKYVISLINKKNSVNLNDLKKVV
jgi:hypothetical protein